MNPHKEALEAIKFWRLGAIQEVARRTPWGFHSDFPLHNISVDDYLKSSYQFVPTTILHILMGEGENPEKALSCLDKALDRSLKVLILEHNPDAPDWRNNKNVSMDKIKSIRYVLDSSGYQYGEVPLGQKSPKNRNVLFVVSAMKRLDLVDITNANFHKLIRQTYSCKLGSDAAGKVYALSSENYKTPGKLLDDRTVNSFESDKDKSLYMVIGGLMFLEALVQIAPEKLVLFDISLHQCIYADVVINGILMCLDLVTFDNYLSETFMLPEYKNKINYFWDFPSLCFSLRNSLKYRSNEKYKFRWRNVLYHGEWRNHYNTVRRRLLDADLVIIQKPLQDLKPEPCAYVYTSTVSRDLFSGIQGNAIIHSLQPRDEPRLEDNRGKKNTVQTHKGTRGRFDVHRRREGFQAPVSSHLNQCRI